MALEEEDDGTKANVELVAPAERTAAMAKAETLNFIISMLYCLGWGSFVVFCFVLYLLVMVGGTEGRRTQCACECKLRAPDCSVPKNCANAGRRTGRSLCRPRDARESGPRRTDCMYGRSTCMMATCRQLLSFE